MEVQLAWLLFGLYLLSTTLLALRGMGKTKDFSGFALGHQDLGPFVTGITLASAVASTATFVINPGFVYSAGLSALLHYGVSANLGVLLGLIVFSRGFRKLGLRDQALTLPHWMEARYHSEGLRSYFALLNLVVASTFIVLILRGSALVMMGALQLSYLGALLIIVLFVFSYILLGGTYAHVYTNAFQGSLMIGIALLLFASGLHYFSSGWTEFSTRLSRIDPGLVAWVHPTAPLFDDPITVFGAGFIVGLGLVAQPHVLTKALYLRSDRDLTRFFVYGCAVYAVYALVLLVGLYARLALPEVATQDAVVVSYVQTALPVWLGAPVAVALLAAGMSTLDGILVSASTIAANDILLGRLGRRWSGGLVGAARSAAALRASRVILVLLGLISFAIAVNPPKLVGIFAQWGVYGLVAASLVPVGVGCVWNGFSKAGATAAAVAGPLVHFGYYGAKTHLLGEIINPAESASFAILVSALVALVAHYASSKASDV